jgi:hypothetical protein
MTHNHISRKYIGPRRSGPKRSGAAADAQAPVHPQAPVDPQAARQAQSLASLIPRSRRFFLGQCSLGLGGMALGSLLAKQHASAADQDAGAELDNAARRGDPLAVRAPHYAPKAKRVIHLFMAGGPSQLELFDQKPKLRELDGQSIPESFVENKRFAFIKPDASLVGTRRKFRRYGQCGMEMSEILPHVGGIADDITLIRTAVTKVFNHGPAKVFFTTGSPQFGRPAMGAWVTYGIGSPADDLPGFVVLQSGPRGPRGGTGLYGSGFLPSVYQGVPLRGSGDPVLNLSNPPGVTAQRQRTTLDAIADMNAARLAATGDPEIATRIASYEMAYRMQTSAPELIDLSGESRETLDLYGAEPGKASFANNCLLARRLVERGVRFVQLFHTDWDHHGGKGANLEDSLDRVVGETDRASAALVMDLKRRGLLDDTIVVWSGEFGRTPMGESRGTVGRDHHIDAFSQWVAGGGFAAGRTIGATDELGFYPTETPVPVHDLQATMLHLLGLDHLKLTYRFQGRDFRLTDVEGDVRPELLA